MEVTGTEGKPPTARAAGTSLRSVLTEISNDRSVPTIRFTRSESCSTATLASDVARLDAADAGGRARDAGFGSASRERRDFFRLAKITQCAWGHCYALAQRKEFGSPRPAPRSRARSCINAPCGAILNVKMHRWLLTFLLVLLPLQFVWAAAAPYCGHEQSSDAQHVGHHAHVHRTSKSEAPGAEHSLVTSDAGTTLDNDLDNDCVFCQHSACKSVIFEVSSLADIARSAVQAPTDAVRPMPEPDHIERPNWPRLS
jgi:hypothetical protein